MDLTPALWGYLSPCPHWFITRVCFLNKDWFVLRKKLYQCMFIKPGTIFYKKQLNALLSVTASRNGCSERITG